jgi:hypothetical protein
VQTVLDHGIGGDSNESKKADFNGESDSNGSLTRARGKAINGHRSQAQKQAEVLGWAQWGCGVWAAAILADVPVCEALRMIESGQQDPRSPHHAWAVEIGRLEARHAVASSYGWSDHRRINGHHHGNEAPLQLTQFTD